MSHSARGILNPNEKDKNMYLNGSSGVVNNHNLCYGIVKTDGSTVCKDTPLTCSPAGVKIPETSTFFHCPRIHLSGSALCRPIQVWTGPRMGMASGHSLIHNNCILLYPSIMATIELFSHSVALLQDQHSPP